MQPSSFTALTKPSITLPDEVAESLGEKSQVPRRVLEALILQRYLSEEISIGRLAELLGFTRIEAEDFLDCNNARLPYTPEMLHEDRCNLGRYLTGGEPRRF
jgi:predicted HTH domain antitoxin